MKEGTGGGGGHCIRHKVFWYRRSAWTNVVHLRNPNRRRLNLEHNNSRISQVYAARAASRLAALIHNIHHRGNWWAKSRPNDFLRRQSEGGGDSYIFYDTSWFIHAALSPDHRLSLHATPWLLAIYCCTRSTAGALLRCVWNGPADAAPPVIHTRNSLPSTKTPPRPLKKTTKTKQPKKKKKRCRAINEGHRCKTTCLTVIVFAPGRNIASFSPSLPYLYEGGKQFISSLQITQRGDDETSEGIWCAVSKKTWDPLNFMNKWMN